MVDEDTEHFHYISYQSRGHKWNKEIKNFIKKVAGVKQKDELHAGLLATEDAILRRSGLMFNHTDHLSPLQLATALVSPVDYRVS